MAISSSTFYFGYGSNLWQDQMQRRCPTSTYVGVGRLRDYRWIINERGYANIVECNGASDSDIGESTRPRADCPEEVYGLIFALTPNDEENLDINEGVPEAYTKENLSVDFWSSHREKRPVDVGRAPEKCKMLVYIDRKRLEPHRPKKEYIYRMNMGILDAERMGVPREYVDRVLRLFIPQEDSSEENVRLARNQALCFRDEL